MERMSSSAFFHIRIVPIIFNFLSFLFSFTNKYRVRIYFFHRSKLTRIRDTRLRIKRTFNGRVSCLGIFGKVTTHLATWIFPRPCRGHGVRMSYRVYFPCVIKEENKIFDSTFLSFFLFFSLSLVAHGSCVRRMFPCRRCRN